MSNSSRPYAEKLIERFLLTAGQQDTPTRPTVEKLLCTLKDVYRADVYLISKGDTYCTVRRPGDVGDGYTSDPGMMALATAVKDLLQDEQEAALVAVEQGTTLHDLGICNLLVSRIRLEPMGFGALIVANRRGGVDPLGVPFVSLDKQLVRMVAGLLESNLRESTLTGQVRRLKDLDSVTKAVLTLTSMEARLNVIWRHLEVIFGCKAGSWFVYNRRTRRLEVERFFGLSTEPKNRPRISFGSGQGIAGHAWKSKQPYYTNNAASDPHYKTVEGSPPGNRSHGSVLAFHVSSLDGLTDGVICLLDKDGGFSHEDLDQAEQISGTISLLLDRSLNQHMASAKGQLAKRLLAETDSARACKTLAETIAMLVDADACFIGLVRQEPHCLGSFRRPALSHEEIDELDRSDVVRQLSLEKTIRDDGEELTEWRILGIGSRLLSLAHPCYIWVARGPTRRVFGNIEEQLLHLMAPQVAMTVDQQLADQRDQLNERVHTASVEELRTLAGASPLRIGRVLSWAIKKAKELFKADQAFVIIVDERMQPVRHASTGLESQVEGAWEQLLQICPALKEVIQRGGADTRGGVLGPDSPYNRLFNDESTVSVVNAVTLKGDQILVLGTLFKDPPVAVELIKDLLTGLATSTLALLSRAESDMRRDLRGKVFRNLAPAHLTGMDDQQVATQVMQVFDARSCSMLLLKEGQYKVVASTSKVFDHEGEGIVYNPAAPQFTSLALRTGRSVRVPASLTNEAVQKSWPELKGRQRPHFAEDPEHNQDALLAIPLQKANGDVLGAIRVGREASFLRVEQELLEELARRLSVRLYMARIHGELDQVQRRMVRLTATNTLAAGMSHAIKNPLMALKTSLELLRLKDPALQERHGESLDEIFEQAERIKELLDDLTCNFWPTDHTPHPSENQGGNLDGLISGMVIPTIRPVAQSFFVELRVALEEEAASAPITSQGLGLSLVNLLTNGVEVAGQDGWVRLSASAQDGNLVIEVEDSGPGVTREIRNRVFDPFFTTKPRGTGIGLSMAHSTVSRLGGRLELMDDRNHGALFRIMLPLEEVSDD